MSLTRLPAELRRRAAFQHPLATIPQRRQASSSPLFALAQLSNSRETQHFNKATKLSRVEHSPALKLIQTSEVDPFASDKPAKRETSSVPTPPPEKEGIDHEALVELPVAARREIWYAWYQSDRSKSLAELAGRWGEKQPTTASPAGDGAEAARPSSTTPSGEPAARKDGDTNEIEEALKIGRAFINGNTEKKRELAQKLKEARWEIAQLKKTLEDAEAESTRVKASPNGAVVASSLILISVVIWACMPAVKSDGGSAGEQLARLEKAHADLRTEHAGCEAEWKRAEAAAQGAIDDKSRALEVEVARNDAHSARMADWTQKAEDLKRAVERKDVRDLSKAEQTAYLEALVFLGVKDRPEKRWWKGLFWKQE